MITVLYLKPLSTVTAFFEAYLDRFLNGKGSQIVTAVYKKINLAYK